MKGMVLAAGFGTRLHPLSDAYPKPMLPVANMPMIDYALHRLSVGDINEVVVNLHHLPEPIREHLKNKGPFAQEITLSEEPQILGTGGGIKAVREWVGDNTLCVTNGDTLLLTDIPQVIRAHEQSDALVTMVLIPETGQTRFSPVAVSGFGDVVDIGGALKKEHYEKRGVFVGLHILAPEVFNHMPDRDHFCIIQDVYLPLMEKLPGSIGAHFVKGRFFDMGTPEDYLRSNIVMLTEHLHENSVLTKGLRHLGDRVFVGNNLRLGRNVSLVGPCIIGDNVKIEGGSEIGPATAVGSGAYIGAWARMHGCVICPKALIPGGGMHRESIFFDREVLSLPGLFDGKF